MAKKIKIISDSTSDLPKDLLEQYQIEIIPLIVMEAHRFRILKTRRRWNQP